jgi:DNA-binding transcriptional ArsR family regulator
MKRQTEESFRAKCRFEVSLRYELFYSLNTLLDPNARIHAGWRRSALRALGGEFNRHLGEIGRSWEIWPAMAALMPGRLLSPSFADVLASLKRLPLESFREKILRGLVHSDEAVAALLEDKATLKSAIARVPRAKREWISHIGLFPYDAASPQVVALERLLSDAGRFRAIVLRILELYWQKCFKPTWERLQPQLRRSLEARERLFHSCSFAEFAREALLRIEIDEAKGEIRAIRGGYRLKLRDVDACYFVPSAFNDRRFWSAFSDGGKTVTAYFPYFDPAITLGLQAAGDVLDVADPALDPALIFKALGDSTRFAIATILARTPTCSVELARMLSVSKPTISHHVQLLREAGLLQETYLNGAVELSLKRAVLQQLSDLAVARLFDADAPLRLTRTRGGALS